MDRVFWPLLGVGIVLLFLASPGYIEMGLAVVFVLLTVLWFKLNDVIKARESFQLKLEQYFSMLESMIMEKPEPVQTGVSRDEMNDLLDRFAKKLIDVENKLNQFRKTLAAAFSALDERIKAVEEETFPRDETNG